MARDAAHGPSASAVGRPFVGRRRELAELEVALATAAEHGGAVTLVTGEGGIGKSRLLDEFGQLAARRGWQLLASRCWEGGGAPAYWPWMQVVRAAGGDFEALSRPAASDPETARFLLFEAVADYLSGVASDRPTVVMVDDLHVADEPSLVLLRFLATHPRERVLVVGSYRDGDDRVRDRAELFADLVRVSHRIPLRGLTLGEVRRYFEALAERPPTDSVVARIHAVTGGNAFFVSELVRLLVSDGGRVESPRAVEATLHQLPEEVRVLIRRRVAGLSPEAIKVLRSAAVIGSRFALPVLHRTSGLTSGRLLGVIEEAVATGVLVEDSAVPGRYGFVHDLMRETLYEDLPGEQRLELHRRVGHVLAELADDPDSQLAELAHHFTMAATLGEADAAVEYSLRAGDRATALLAYEEAVTHYRRGLELLPLAEAHTGADRGAVLLKLADAQWRAGAPEAAGSSAAEAARAARAAGDSQMLARAALCSVTAWMPARQLGGVLLGGSGATRSPALDLLEEALAELPADDSPLRARLLATLATELYTSEGLDRRVAVADEAVEMARRVGDAETLAMALHGRHWASLAPDLIDARLTNAGEMLSVATATGDLEMALLARHCRLHCHLERADIHGVDAELEAMTGIAATLRQPFYHWHVVCLRAMRALLEGRFADGEQLMQQARDLGELRRSEFGTYLHDFAQRIALRWAQGRLGEELDALERHHQRYPGIARWRDALAAAETGDVERARGELERHAARDFADRPRDGLWLLHHCALAEAAVLLGDRRRAGVLYALLRPYADRFAVSVSTLPFGPVAQRLGMLAALLGRDDEADAHFTAARRRCDAIGARPAAARVAYHHARALLARGDESSQARAQTLLDDAAGLVAELGLSGLAARVEALRGARASTQETVSAGGAARRETQPAATFQREGDYWTVAYDGELARLRDRKGLRYLACLLAAPAREIHALELVALGEGTAGGGERASVEEDLRIGGLDGESVLDERAKAAYRERLVELQDDLDEARTWKDTERAARLQAEHDALTTELAGALGLGGRDRALPSPAERARVSVTKAIRTAIKAISRDCPGLGDHLEAAVRTGRLCSYAPPGESPPAWNAEDA